jgi:hypothetical protein
VRLTFGYQLNQWWYLGQTDVSDGNLNAQGVFFRGEWRY